MEGDAQLVLVTRFADAVEVGAHRTALEAIVGAWCDLEACLSLGA